MSELAAFLTARLDEDEQVAKAGTRRIGMPWRIDPEPWATGTGIIDDIGGVGVAAGSYAAEHMVRHNPARVLREVEAKRAILAEHPVDGELLAWSLRQERVRAGETSLISWCLRCCVPVLNAQYEHVDWPCPTLRALAAVYSDHPDYDAEWKR